MHVDFVDENTSQSAKSETPKCQIDTLKCTLEELAVLDLIKKNPSVKQTELAEQTGKSVRSIKRITDSLKEKQYLRRVDGKRYGKWEVLAQDMNDLILLSRIYPFLKPIFMTSFMRNLLMLEGQQKTEALL